MSRRKIGGDDAITGDRPNVIALVRAGTVRSFGSNPKLTMASGFTVGAGLTAIERTGELAGAWQQSAAFVACSQLLIFWQQAMSALSVISPGRQLAQAEDDTAHMSTAAIATRQNLGTASILRGPPAFVKRGKMVA